MRKMGGRGGEEEQEEEEVEQRQREGTREGQRGASSIGGKNFYSNIIIIGGPEKMERDGKCGTKLCKVGTTLLSRLHGRRIEGERKKKKDKRKEGKEKGVKREQEEDEERKKGKG